MSNSSEVVQRKQCSISACVYSQPLRWLSLLVIHGPQVFSRGFWVSVLSVFDIAPTTKCVCVCVNIELCIVCVCVCEELSRWAYRFFTFSKQLWQCGSGLTVSTPLWHVAEDGVALTGQRNCHSPLQFHWIQNEVIYQSVSTSLDTKLPPHGNQSNHAEQLYCYLLFKESIQLCVWVCVWSEHSFALLCVFLVTAAYCDMIPLLFKSEYW